MHTRSEKRKCSTDYPDESNDVTQLSEPQKSHSARPVKKLRATTDANILGLDDMNTDILFEIAENLHPKDLLSLAAVSDGIHTVFFRNPQAVLSWRRSRERTGAPPPPEDMTETRWARLLFRPTCMGCHTTNVQNIDFSVRRRACLECKRQNLIVDSKFHEEFPNLDASILQVVHQTYYPRELNRRRMYPYYWRSDIGEMAHLIETAQDAIDDKGARDEGLQAFMQHRVAMMERMSKVDLRTQFNTWIEAQATAKKNKESERRQAHLSVMYNRLVALGYKAVDICMDNLAREVDKQIKKGVLSNSAWARVRKAMEPRILAAKEKRLETEDKDIRNVRRTLFDDLYAKYHLEVEHSQWKYLPAPRALYDLSPICDIIKSDTSIIVTAETFAGCFEDLSLSIKSVQTKLKWSLLSACCSAAASSLFPEPFDFQADDLVQIDLAILPFHCIGCRMDLFGWDEISSHRCFGVFDLAPNRHAAAYCTAHYVVNLVGLSGLDPMKATVAEMDTLDLRYTCAACKPDAFKEWDIHGVRGVAKAYTWRNCIYHIQKEHLKDSEEDRRTLKFEVLSSKLAELVRARELILERNEGSQWACAHCTWPLPLAGSYAEVMGHLKSAEGHNINTPNEADDLVNIRQKGLVYSVEYQAIPKPPYESPVACLIHAHTPAVQERYRCNLLPYHQYLNHALDSSPHGDDWIPEEGRDYVFLTADDVPAIWREAHQPEAEPM